MARLYLVRHGQTDWNAEKRIQGRVERSLNEIGRKQARDLGEKFAHLQLLHMYCSPMRRAKETALLMAAFHPSCKIIEEELLKEASFGCSVEGLTRHDYRVQFAKDLEKRKHSSKEERWVWKIDPDAESLAEIVARAIPCLEQICVRHLGEDIIVVTHGGLMKAVLAFFNNYDDKGLHIENGQVIVIGWDGEKLRQYG